MKKLLVIIAFVLFINAAKAQSLDNAIKEIQKENLVKAKIELLKIYSTTKNLDAAFYLGNVYLKDGVIDSAKYYYSIAETGSSALSSVAKAKLSLMNGGSDDAAKAIAEKALSVSKRKDAEVLFQVGQLAYRPNPVNVSAYIDFVKEAATLTENKYYTLVLGDMYLDLNQGGKAMSNYEDVTMVDSNHVLANIRVGRLYYSAKNYDMAIKYLERANRVSEEDARALEGNLNIELPKEIIEAEHAKGVKETDIKVKIMTELLPNLKSTSNSTTTIAKLK